jgi:hypothetical protein
MKSGVSRTRNSAVWRKLLYTRSRFFTVTSVGAMPNLLLKNVRVQSCISLYKGKSAELPRVWEESEEEWDRILFAVRRNLCAMRVVNWRSVDVLHFSIYKGTPCLKLLIPTPNGNHSEFVAGRPADQKQLLHASQIAALQTLFATESPFPFCNFMDRERGGNGNVHAIKPWTMLFRSIWKHTCACVCKAVMATWNHSNHFGTSVQLSRSFGRQRLDKHVHTATNNFGGFVLYAIGAV